MKIALTSIPVDDPLKAHDFYTKVLGMQSKQFDAEMQLAIVVSPEDPNGSALLLEPRGDSFVKEFQEKVYQAGLPVIIFGVDNPAEEVLRLKEKGVIFREDLANKEWGLENIFEDTCGNFIMLQANDTA
ncbi:MAG: VOC family protein [Puniceicoccaceae bacterium]